MGSYLAVAFTLLLSMACHAQTVSLGQLTNTKWKLDKKYPVEIKVDPNDRTKLTLKWLSSYSGQLILSYGEYTKTIVVESLY